MTQPHEGEEEGGEGEGRQEQLIHRSLREKTSLVRRLVKMPRCPLKSDPRTGHGLLEITIRTGHAYRDLTKAETRQRWDPPRSERRGKEELLSMDSDLRQRQRDGERETGRDRERERHRDRQTI
jgi:hypothetical protein